MLIDANRRPFHPTSLSPCVHNPSGHSSVVQSLVEIKRCSERDRGWNRQWWYSPVRAAGRGEDNELLSLVFYLLLPGCSRRSCRRIRCSRRSDSRRFERLPGGNCCRLPPLTRSSKNKNTSKKEKEINTTSQITCGSSSIATQTTTSRDPWQLWRSAWKGIVKLRVHGDRQKGPSWSWCSLIRPVRADGLLLSRLVVPSQLSLPRSTPTFTSVIKLAPPLLLAMVPDFLIQSDGCRPPLRSVCRRHQL